MAINNLSELVEMARKKGPKRVAVVAPHDRATLMAALQAQREGLAQPILVGDPEIAKRVAAEGGLDLGDVTIVAEAHPRSVVRKAVELVNAGRADLIMNGLALPRQLIEVAQEGLGMGGPLTYVGVFEIPGFDRSILVADIGAVVSPTFEQKVTIVQNAIEVARRLGIEEPKVAVLSATESVSPKIPLSLEAANLSKMSQRGQIVGGVVDGPLALDLAISPHSAHIKGVPGEVAGQADVIIVPDIEAGCLLAQTIVYFARGKMAGVVVGGKCPLAMPFRAASAEEKLASLALGVLMT